ncbi:tannase/feruloyl esterase family alpha/beta hydrolase [Pseudalkalibacillus sp. A8]|uniref:alpha/beta hydrolase family protein n=1 Tax=Pseudalkalibacillus sp. A8 TaxID=3382641 RepID=UPI0038B47D37
MKFIRLMIIICLFSTPFLLQQGVNASNQSVSKECENVDGLSVPSAEKQKIACLDDLSTEGLVLTGHTNPNDWAGLHAAGTANPIGIPGIQIDGYFPDTSTTNKNNNWNHDSQFVIRLPDNWNGKLIITGAPGNRAQYANDFIISDWVLSKGYAFASTDKGNTGLQFYKDGDEPGDAIAEWHERVRELTVAVKKTIKQYYGTPAKYIYMTGISNGGYLTRYAIENSPDLFDGGVDWEGTLFSEDHNLLQYLPTALTYFPEYKLGSEEAHKEIIQAGFEPGSEFLWDYHYSVYWDLTQRIYREELDPTYDGELEAGIPFCQQGTPNCDADYNYEERKEIVQEAIAKVALTGKIKKPMITLHGTLDTLLPIKTDSDVYTKMIKENGERNKKHRYYTIEDGTHTDSLYDQHPDKLRPILPCYRESIELMEQWVEGKEKPPENQFVEHPESGDVVNSCTVQ